MRKTRKRLSRTKQRLLDALNIKNVGVGGLIARFTHEELQIIASQRGQLMCGNKRELAAKIVRAEDGRCRHGMFYTGAGACLACGG